MNDKDYKVMEGNTNIHGIVYKANSTVYFHDNGRVMQGKVARKTIVHGIVYKKYSTIKLNRDGSINYE